MENPLLQMTGLPPFSQIQPEHIEPAIEQILRESREKIESLLSSGEPYTWENLVAPLEAIEERLGRVWSPISHMNAVVNTDALRTAYNNCRLKLSEYYTELGQNEKLYQAYQSIASSPEYETLSVAQKKIIDNALRDFRLSGVALPPAEKERYREIQKELSQLTSKFDENVLDATNHWQKQITDEALLAGLPESARALARQTAQEREKEGWLFTLEFPSYLAVMTHADNRALRQEMYEAYVTRASELGPGEGRWDNTPIMEKILALRHEMAKLLGFSNYAERSLATKMAKRTEQVMRFLEDLAERSLPIARAEFEELKSFAREHLGLSTLEAWDVPYSAEKLRQHKYAISQEDLKPYFPEPRVLSGMFEVVKRLYGLTIRPRSGVDTWHKDVRFFEIYDEAGELRGQFYLDLYARPKKRGGAWMAECINRYRTASGVQVPVAYLTCNFSPPVGDDPALFTHSEVLTLFHEFGHGLHHMLTRVDYPSVGGINGVPWDAVELPSQFMENFCWEREALALISGHYKTGEKLPEALFQKMLAAKNFQAGMQMVRQLEFGLFDFRLHLEFDPAQGARIRELESEVRRAVAVVQPPSYNRFSNAFHHIFAGGYAAGYYSYKWAEVLSADAYSLFQEKGIFDRETGQKFLTSILEQGGTREPMELFVAFRGREPQIDALLRNNGML